MHHLVENLIIDHKRLQTVQAVLKQEIDAFEQGYTRLDLALLLDVMEYLKGYPELVHHPLEDRIYQSLRPAIDDDETLAVLDDIELQHAQLYVLSKRLSDDFYAVANDQIVSRERIIYDTKQYLQLAETHLKNENAHLFPIITKVFSLYDLKVIALELSKKKDPLFVQREQGAYDHLYKKIVTSTTPELVC